MHTCANARQMSNGLWGDSLILAGKRTSRQIYWNAGLPVSMSSWDWYLGFAAVTPMSLIVSVSSALTEHWAQTPLTAVSPMQCYKQYLKNSPLGTQALRIQRANHGPRSQTVNNREHWKCFINILDEHIGEYTCYSPTYRK